MAKLGSSSCRPLLQGMMLLAILLLASIQAGPVTAAWVEVEQAVDHGREAVGELMDHGREAVGELVDHGRDAVVKKGQHQAIKELSKKPGWKDFSDGLKKGLKFHKYSCKAQRWVDKLNSGGTSGTSYFTVEFLGDGGDLLSKSFPTFSYSVTSNSVVPFCWSAEKQVQAAGTTPPTMMFVRIKGLRVGQEDVPVQPPPPVYLGTAQPYTYYDLQSSLNGRLREAVNRQVKVNPPWAKPIINNTDTLCYPEAALSRPLLRIAILLANENGEVMTMELGGGAATDTIWYQELSSMFCLGIHSIQRTVELLISLGTP